VGPPTPDLSRSGRVPPQKSKYLKCLSFTREKVFFMFILLGFISPGYENPSWEGAEPTFRNYGKQATGPGVSLKGELKVTGSPGIAEQRLVAHQSGVPVARRPRLGQVVGLYLEISMTDGAVSGS
jgi:hypothetical protein